MKRTMAISFALLLSIGSFLLFLSCQPEVRVEAAEDPETDPPPDDLIISEPFSLNDGYYYSTDLVWHSNGDLYRFRGERYNYESEEPRFDTRLRMMTLDEEGDVIKDEHFRLPSFSEDFESINDFTEYFFEAENGDIYGMIVMRTGGGSSYYSVDPDQYIQVHLTYDQEKGDFDIDSRYIMEIEDLDEMFLHHLSIGDKHFSVFHFCDGWNIIPYDSEDPVNETFHVDDLGGSVLPFSSLVVGNEIAAVFQGPGGVLNLTFLDPALNITRTYEFDAYPEGIGYDNKLYSMYEGSDIHVMIYRDELAPEDLTSGYSYLDHFSISTDGSLKGSKKVVLDHPELIWYDLTPILFQEDIYVIHPALNGMCRFDGSMGLRYFYEFKRDDWWYYPQFEMKLVPFEGQHLIMAKGSYYQDGFGIMIHPTDEFPKMGSYTFVEDKILLGEVLEDLETIYIEEGVSVLMEDTSLVLGPTLDPYYPEIINRGDLTLKNFTYSNYRSIDIINHGTLILEDVNIEGGLHGKGNLTFIGSNNLFVDPGHDYEKFANITIKDLVQVGPGKEETDIGTLIRYLNYNGKFNVVFEDCKIIRKQELITTAARTASFFNCTFEDIYAWGGGVDLTFMNCDFTNVSEVEMRDDSSCNFIDCTFEDCHSILTGRPSSVDIVNCTFSGAPFITSELWTTWLNITGSEFSSSRGFFDGYHIDDLYVKGTSFENCQEIFIYRGDSIFDVQDCLFLNCNRTIGIEYENADPVLFNFKENRFIGNGLAAYMIRDMLYDEDLFSYDDPDETLSDNHIQMFDMRGNYWDSNDPDVVASRISFGFIFLPYRTIDGTIVSTDDNDADGMKDEWEVENGLDPGYYFDRFRDNDLDGFSNYEEYKMGFDPMDHSSSPNRNFLTRRVVPWMIGLSILFSVLFVALFPLNARWRSIKIYSGKREPRWESEGIPMYKRERTRPQMLRLPEKEEVIKK